jgi:hypothetical protein
MIKKLFVLCALVALVPVSALAATRIANTFGPRIGLSNNPDQVVFGGQLSLGEVAPDLSLSPNVEVGLGDHMSLIALNADLQYHFAVQGSSWKPYAGGGLSVNWFSFDDRIGGGSDTQAGVNFLVGAAVPTKTGSQFFSELRLGAGDIPDLKLMFGWNFMK